MYEPQNLSPLAAQAFAVLNSVKLGRKVANFIGPSRDVVMKIVVATCSECHMNTKSRSKYKRNMTIREKPVIVRGEMVKNQCQLTNVKQRKIIGSKSLAVSS